MPKTGKAARAAKRAALVAGAAAVAFGLAAPAHAGDGWSTRAQGDMNVTALGDSWVTGAGGSAAPQNTWYTVAPLNTWYS
ncbi:hypothetical protein [Allonocardiopsis opalescens]|nr:hypothetical protein [Allonocardiopsis opalescens]